MLPSLPPPHLRASLETSVVASQSTLFILFFLRYNNNTGVKISLGYYIPTISQDDPTERGKLYYFLFGFLFFLRKNSVAAGSAKRIFLILSTAC